MSTVTVPSKETHDRIEIPLQSASEDIWQRKYQLKNNQGEAVGVIAAQSIGEPGTQYHSILDPVILEKLRTDLPHLQVIVFTVVGIGSVLAVPESDLHNRIVSFFDNQPK